jgi:branched-chain amino acid transport system ATP-binding protein
MLKLDRLTAGYGHMPVLHGISIDVAPQKITALIGSNGSGKSTTLKAIMNAIPIFSGTVTLDGRPLANLSTNEVVAAGISMVPEGRKIFSGLSVLENLRVGAFLRSDKKRMRAKLAEILELFPRLAERQNSAGTSLSGGEQQMLAIGRALMSEPKVLLLDEPSMGLAPIVTEQVFQAIGQLPEQGCTVLLVEQNARLALSMVDYAYVLENGELVMSGAGKELLADPRIVSSYLGG